MPRLTLTLAAALAAVVAGAAHAQADNTNSRIVPNDALTTDVYEANKDAYPWGNRYYDSDPRYAYERRYYYESRPGDRPLTPHEAETIYGYPYPYAWERPYPYAYERPYPYASERPYPYAYERREHRLPAGPEIGARQDSNPNDFESGIYNPKP
jgi:hypothetical protein